MERINIVSDDSDGEDTGRKYEKKFGLDMGFDEALERFAGASKEEVELGRKKPTQPVEQGEFALSTYRKAEIRKIFHNGEWWFSVVDAVGAVSKSSQPRKYWSDLKKTLVEKEGFEELSDHIGQLKMPASDGKLRDTDVCNTETLLRILQSIKSPNAEPFKRWLARVGYERIQENQNPEIAIQRAIVTYQLQGRSDDWIEKRIRSIVTRKELTNEWAKRGITEHWQYGSLTNLIAISTFGVKPDAHKDMKGLRKSHELRDHMTDLELIFTMLGEKSTTEIAKVSDAKGFKENADAAKAGGKIAGSARMQLEQETNKRVVSTKNFLGGKSRQGDVKKLSGSD